MGAFVHNGVLIGLTRSIYGECEISPFANQLKYPVTARRLRSRSTSTMKGVIPDANSLTVHRAFPRGA